MVNPKIMIFDEPFNGIEEDTVNKLKRVLLEAKNSNRIIIATHIKQDIQSLVDVIYRLDNGTIFKEEKED